MERSKEDIETMAADLIRSYKEHFATNDISRLLEGVGKLLEEKEAKFFTQHLGILGGRDLCNVKEAIERGWARAESAKVEVDRKAVELSREPEPTLLAAFDKAVVGETIPAPRERKVEAKPVAPGKGGRFKKG
jgi:hypothetical protein